MTEEYGPKRVLVVDDEPFVLNAVKRTFRRYADEFEVVTANNMKEALGLLETGYDAAILDGLNGDCIPLYERIKEASPDTKVVFHSSDPDFKKAAGERGIKFFEKPSSLADLVKELKDQ